MNTQIHFDATNVPVGKPLDAVPADWYTVVVRESENATTANGKAVKIVADIVGGAHAGRKIYDCINYENTSTVAQRIGQETLSGLCHATGVITINDTTLLHNIPIMVKVGIKAGQNVVKGYKPVEGAAVIPGAAAIINPGATAVAPPVPSAVPPPPVVPPVPAATPPVAALPVTPPVPPVPAAVPPVPPAPAPVPAAFVPPQGWVAHPGIQGSYYCGQEIATEAELVARMAAAPAPAPALPLATPENAPWQQK